MNNIDWSTAPKWAQYAAMDSDGEWFWFDSKPELYENDWFNVGRCAGMHSVKEYDYENSLTERPKKL